jgi:hypothetical protein
MLALFGFTKYTGQPNLMAFIRVMALTEYGVRSEAPITATDRGWKSGSSLLSGSGIEAGRPSASVRLMSVT